MYHQFNIIGKTICLQVGLWEFEGHLLAGKHLVHSRKSVGLKG